MRLYEPIWIKIRQAGEIKVVIQSPSHLVTKTIKAVTKEKYNDVAYKIVLDSKGRMAKLRHEVTEHEQPEYKYVTFWLEFNNHIMVSTL